MRHVEAGHQRTVCQWLEANGVLYCHVPNERAQGLQRQILAGLGVKPGVPDLLIFTPPPSATGRGVAIEMKAPLGRASSQQLRWINDLEHAGWLARVCRGCDEAIAWLEFLGYGMQP
ncbi:MAG: VRR-NUC domain-containing protein [Gemmatimonadota bacterium]